MRSLGLVMLALLSPLLVACGSDNEPSSDSTSSSPTPAVEPDDTYGTADELMEAAVESGYFCKNWRLTNKVNLAASSGNCSGDDVFSVFATESDRDAQINQQRTFSEDYGMEMSTVLVGPTWSINSSNASDLREAMGGVIFGG